MFLVCLVATSKILLWPSGLQPVVPGMCAMDSSSHLSLKYLLLNETLLMNWVHIIPENSHWDLTTSASTRKTQFITQWRRKSHFQTQSFINFFIPKLLLTKVRKVFAVITSPSTNSLYGPQLDFSLKLSIMRKREEKGQKPAAPVTVRHQ